jgi:hypothetical protein
MPEIKFNPPWEGPPISPSEVPRSIIIATLESEVPRHRVAFSTTKPDVAFIPRERYIHEVEDYINESWNLPFEKRVKVRSISVVPADGYPYYV